MKKSRHRRKLRQQDKEIFSEKTNEPIYKKVKLPYDNFAPGEDLELIDAPIDLIIEFYNALGFDTSGEKWLAHWLDPETGKITPKTVYRGKIKYCGPKKTKKGKIKSDEIITLYHKLDLSEYRQHNLSDYRSKLGYFNKEEYRRNGIMYNYDYDLTDDEIELLMGKKSDIGLCGNRYLENDITRIDIDNHSNDPDMANKILLLLLKDFEFTTPLFIERSNQNGGWHLFIKIKGKVPDGEFREYERMFKKKHGLKIEFKTPNQALKLPGSYTYVPGIITNLKELKKDTTFEINFLPYKSKIEMFSDIIFNSREQKEEMFRVEKFYKLIKKQNPDTTPQKKPVEPPELKIPKPKKIPLTYRLNSKSFKKDVYNDYSMTRENRWDNYKKLGFACIYQNLSLQDFTRAVISNNHGSRDITKWIEKGITEKNCEKMYKWSQKYFKKKSSLTPTFNPDIFISNTHLLTDTLKLVLEKYLEIIIKQNSKTYKKWNQVFSRDLPIMTAEILAKLIYEEQNPKKINKLLNLKKKTRDLLENHFSIDRSFLSKMKKHYGMKSCVHTLFNTLAKKGNLLRQKKTLSPQGYSWGTVSYSRQWKTKYHNNKNMNMESKLLLIMRDSIIKYNNKNKPNNIDYVKSCESKSKVYRNLEELFDAYKQKIMEKPPP